MPWGEPAPHPTWTGAKCTPLDPEPRQPGDACTVEDHVASGIDDCDVASMCYFVNEETLQGICVPFCVGTPEEPTCEDPNAVCVVGNDGVFIPCVPKCDPLLQDCADGQACYFDPFVEAFVCGQDYSGPDMGAHGDPCDYIDACDPGLNCTFADFVPGCQGSLGCCSPFCDTTAPNTCPGMAEGEECVAIWGPGQGPPEYQHVGVCMLP